MGVIGLRRRIEPSLTVDVSEDGKTRTGRLVEFGPTEEIFQRPRDPRTEAYVSGKFG